MPVLLVRHAQALPRPGWNKDDRLRPLSSRGRKQSRELVSALSEYKVTRIMSSPYVRCLDTVAPLGEALGLPVDADEILAEGSTTAAVEFVRSLAAEDILLCTHGDVIPLVLAALNEEFRLGIKPTPRNAKASTWALESKRGRFVTATYIKAPRV
jgi:broad specificity phosphatase PhoE